MKDGDVDYSGYSIAELREALSGIDKARYPKNYQRLKGVCLEKLDPNLISLLAEESDDEAASNNQTHRMPSNYSIFYTQFCVGLACLPMIIIGSIQEDFLDATIIVLIGLCILISVINIDSLRILFHNSRSRNAWLALMLSSALMMFARFLNDFFFFFLMIVWIGIMISCWAEINICYVEYLKSKEQFARGKNRL
jgi:hypothetical protein